MKVKYNPKTKENAEYRDLTVGNVYRVIGLCQDDAERMRSIIESPIKCSPA